VGNSTTIATGTNTSAVHPAANNAAGSGCDVVSRTGRLARKPATAARDAVGYSSGEIQTPGTKKLTNSQIKSELAEIRIVSPTDARSPVRSRNSRYWIDSAGMTARIASVATMVKPE